MSIIKTVTIEVQGQLQWSVWQGQSGRWIGECEPMNLAVEADSPVELMSIIEETLQLMLVDLVADDELDRYLSDRGWSADHIPAREDANAVAFNVPWHVLAGHQRDSARRAH